MLSLRNSTFHLSISPVNDKGQSPPLSMASVLSHSTRNVFPGAMWAASPFSDSTTQALLSDIFGAIQRLEAQLGNQTDRLSAIERSTQWNASAGSPKPFHEVKWPGSNPPVTPPETPISLYQKSIEKLRSRFEFVEDDEPVSRSDCTSPGPEPQPEDDAWTRPDWLVVDGGRVVQAGASSAQHTDAKADEADAYSISVYTEQLLATSRHQSQLLMPMAPQQPECSCAVQGSARSYEDPSEAFDRIVYTEPRRAPSPEAGSLQSSSVTGSDKTRKSKISLSSIKSSVVSAVVVWKEGTLRRIRGLKSFGTRIGKRSSGAVGPKAQHRHRPVCLPPVPYGCPRGFAFQAPHLPRRSVLF